MFSSQSEVTKIKKLLINHPEKSFLSQTNLDNYWEKFNYLSCPDYAKAIIEYNNFVELLGSLVDKIEFYDGAYTGIDSIYIRDTSIITAKGAILLNMGKAERLSEPNAVGEYYKKIDIPILGQVNGDGKAEGGDIVWLDNQTLVIGQGYRTNEAGINQIRELTKDFVKELIVVPLPHWDGPADVLHLMSFISPIDHNLALVYSRLMPVPFREYLINRGIELVEVPDEEYESMGCNVLAVAPRICVALEGNPITHGRLKEAGAVVHLYKGDEISRKGSGGPTCLTRPLWRS
ncbi:MAG: amidinotransferase [Candidatus Zixiibacteriota bacterium]|nr:MAG: amidinotransferase [candidate division Zixibacteria bacterium]